MVNILLALRNVDVNARDADGQTPLLLAAEGGRRIVVDAVALLATGKVGANLEDNIGETPLLGPAWPTTGGYLSFRSVYCYSLVDQRNTCQRTQTRTETFQRNILVDMLSCYTKIVYPDIRYIIKLS